MKNEETIKEALALAERGFAVFPILPNEKVPACAGGCKSASTNPDVLRDMFRTMYQCNYGIEASRSGLVLIDVDVKPDRDGNAALQALIKHFGKLPKTLSARTPSGGLHLYYRRPDGARIENHKDHPIIGLGLEIKANNQYLVAPPSRLPNGEYVWIDPDVPIAVCPEWLCQLTVSASMSDTIPVQKKKEAKPECKFQYTAADVIEKFNANYTIESKLSEYGYSHGSKSGFMRHPNHDSADSVHILGDTLSYHFGAGDPLGRKGLGKDQCCFTPFQVEAVMKFGGDAKEAVKAISVELGMNERNDDPAPAVKSLASVIETQLEIDDLKCPWDKRVTIKLPAAKVPKAIRAIADYLAAQTNEPISLRHIFCAASATAAVIGKRAVWHNRGNSYYPAFSAVILARSGTNKSGFCTQLVDLTTDLCSTFAATTNTIESFIEFYGKVITDKSNRKAAIQHIRNEERKNVAGEYLVIDEYRAFVMTMVPASDAIRAGQLFCKILDNAEVIQGTIKNGWRVLTDPCFTFLGFSQCDPWNTEMRNTAFQVGGLAGRIIPVNTARFDITGYVPGGSGADPKECLAVIDRMLGNLAVDKLRIHFGDDDPIADIKEEFKSHPGVKYIIEHSPTQYELLENKILVQAAKLAAVFTIAERSEAFQSDDISVEPMESLSDINAVKYLPLAYALVGLSHIGNVYHVVQMTELGEKVDKLVEFIGRKGKNGVTKTDIYKSTGMTASELKDLLPAAIESKQLIVKDNRFYKVKPTK